jgi:hypothetical protein
MAPEHGLDAAEASLQNVTQYQPKKTNSKRASSKVNQHQPKRKKSGDSSPGNTLKNEIPVGISETKKTRRTEVS